MSDRSATSPNYPKGSWKVLPPRTFQCCIAKEYYSEHANLVESLHITPRMMIHKKSLRINCSYGMTLNIRNNGLYPRLVHLSTDSPTDTFISIPELELNSYLETDQNLEAKIWIRTSSRRDINRRRHIFVECFHPNIIFQVPIIVLSKDDNPSVSESIVFPSCVPGNKTYFELLIYNPSKDSVRFRYRNTNRGLDVSTSNAELLPPQDYIKVLLAIQPKKLHIYKGFFNVKFGMLPPKPVLFTFTPKSMSVHLNIGCVSFPLTKFGREAMRSITVCNEGLSDVIITGELFKEPPSTSTPATSPSFSPNERLSDKLIEEAVSMRSVLLYDFEEESTVQEVSYDPKASKHFELMMPSRIGANSSSEITMYFRPSYEIENLFPDDVNPPYFLRTRATFCFSDDDECIQSWVVVLNGQIAGVELEVHPKVIDFRRIYLGEEHCAQIKFLNVDSVPAKVVYVDCTKPEEAGIRVTPFEGFLLEPCTRGIFNLSFYSVQPSRFSMELRFKVSNGAYYEVELRGTGQPVQLRTFPNIVEFGSIPIAVPQKRYMLLLNPLAVPITLQVKTTVDGEETPLVLNIRDSTELLPITVRDPIRHLQQVHEDLIQQPELGVFELTNEDPEVKSMRSVESNESIYSQEFEMDVMEPIPTMAAHLLTSLKNKKIFDKSESDRRIIQEALIGLLNTKYFSVFTKHSNYVFMDWNALPSDPREVYCDNEIIYLRPNTGRTITILVVPNKAGYYHRSLSVRICPAIPTESVGSSDDLPVMKNLIKSDFLCSKLWFEYNCVVPDIEWSHEVDLIDRTIYAGEEYDFDMEFKNRSIVGAFLHYEVVPTDMSFRDGTWKYYIDSGASIIAKCAVTFRSLGISRLMGMVKIVGANRPYSFHLLANVRPTEIRITPLSVNKRLQVYQKHKQHFYIDNYTPTHTMLSLKLKDTEFQYLTSKGGALAPTGQSMYTTLVSMFPDPDIYQNTLSIDLQFEHVVMVSLTFRVEGVPLYFEPNIREGFDAGLLYTDTKEDFQDGLYTHRFPIRVINKGRRAYRIIIIRLNTIGPGADLNTSACGTPHALTARFDMEPKNMYVDPSSECQLDIMASSYVEGHATVDFLLQVVDQKYPTSKHIIRVRVQADFIEYQLLWSPKQLNFNYKRCDPLKERSYEETVLLINPCSVPIDKVTLQVSGPFRIKEFYEGSYEKELEIKVDGGERKEIFVILNRGAVRGLSCRQIEGKITVMARGIQLKTLPLRVAIKVPDVVILQPDLVLFDQGKPFESSINLINWGCAPAEFKWKRLWTREQYVGDEDDPAGIASDVLSEILRMLEYNFSCDDEPNITKRYQECRCQYKRFLEDGDMILEILDEVVNDLDLKHRPLLYQPQEQANQDEDRDQSSASLVRETIDDILNRLHILSSEEWSEPSSEYCFASRYIYFYEKRGTIQVLDSQTDSMQCKMHLPHIRRNMEMQASFELAIVGGRSQFLTVTLLNLPRKIRFHKDSVYMGIKPWYESFEVVERVFNVTKYPLQLVLVELKPKPPQTLQEPLPLKKRLVEGYCKLITSDVVKLEPLESDQIRVKGILGFSESFRHTFGAMINNSDSSEFCLRGQGVMPMLDMVSPLPAVPMDPVELEEEYRLLQRIYQYEIFRSITEVDEEVAPAHIDEEEGDQPEDKPSEDFSLLSFSEEDMPSEQQARHDLQLFRMVRTYVMVNNNQELPHATVLRQLILAERYMQRLRFRPELYALHQQVYQTHQKAHKAPGYKQPSLVKHFTVQPIPCEQHGYILDLGSLPRNSLRRFELKLHFFGPGKLIAAARTAVRIPGLFVDFKVTAAAQLANKKFSFWSEKCKSLEYFKDKYRNMFERLMDAEKDPKLKHSHSFDLDELIRHQRDLKPKDRRLIEEYYNSLNPSVYPDHKHHFTLAKIFSGCQSNYSGVDLTIVGFFKPESKFYEKQQLVEDYIFIDLHMGPTLPILLRGVISS